MAKSLFDITTMQYSTSFLKFFIHQLIEKINLLEQIYKNDDSIEKNQAQSQLILIKKCLAHLDKEILPLLSDKKTDIWSVFNITKLYTLKSLGEKFNMDPLAAHHPMMADFIAHAYELFQIAPMSLYNTIPFLNPNILAVDLNTNWYFREPIEFLSNGYSFILKRKNEEANTDRSFDFEVMNYFNNKAEQALDFSPQTLYLQMKTDLLREFAGKIAAFTHKEAQSQYVKSQYLNEELFYEEFIQAELKQLDSQLEGFSKETLEFEELSYLERTGLEKIEAIQEDSIASFNEFQDVQKEVIELLNKYSLNSFDLLYESIMNPSLECKSEGPQSRLKAAITKQVTEDEAISPKMKKILLSEPRMCLHIDLLILHFKHHQARLTTPLQAYLKKFTQAFNSHYKKLLAQKEETILHWSSQMDAELIQYEQDFDAYFSRYQASLTLGAPRHQTSSDISKPSSALMAPSPHALREGSKEEAYLVDNSKPTDDLERLKTNQGLLKELILEVSAFHARAHETLAIDRALKLGLESMQATNERLLGFNEKCEQLLKGLNEAFACIAHQISKEEERQAFRTSMSKADFTPLQKEVEKIEKEMLDEMTRWDDSNLLHNAQQAQLKKEALVLFQASLEQLELKHDKSLALIEECIESLSQAEIQEKQALEDLLQTIFKKNPSGIRLRCVDELRKAHGLIWSATHQREGYIPFKELDEFLKKSELGLSFEDFLNSITLFNSIAQVSKIYRKKQESSNIFKKPSRKEYQTYFLELSTSLKRVLDLATATLPDYQQMEKKAKTLQGLANAKTKLHNIEDGLKKIDAIKQAEQEIVRTNIKRLETKSRILSNNIELLKNIKKLQKKVDSFINEESPLLLNGKWNTQLDEDFFNLNSTHAWLSQQHQELKISLSEYKEYENNVAVIPHLLGQLHHTYTQCLENKFNENLKTLQQSISHEQRKLDALTLQFKPVDSLLAHQSNLAVLAEILSAINQQSHQLNELKSDDLYLKTTAKEKITQLELDIALIRDKLLTINNTVLNQLEGALAQLEQRTNDLQLVETQVMQEHNKQLLQQISEEEKAISTVSGGLDKLYQMSEVSLQNKIEAFHRTKASLVALIENKKTSFCQIDTRIPQRNSLICRVSDALEEYKSKRLQRYKYQDLQRCQFIDELKEALKTYTTTANRNQVIALIKQGLLEHKGIHFKGLLSKVAISLIDFDFQKPIIVSPDLNINSLEAVNEMLAKPEYRSYKQGFKALYKSISETVEDFNQASTHEKASLLELLSLFKKDVNRFILTHPTPTPQDLQDFQEQASYRLHSKDEMLGQIYHEWSRIIGNFLLIIGKLFCSQTMTRKALYFFEKAYQQENTHVIEKTLRNITKI